MHTFATAVKTEFYRKIDDGASVYTGVLDSFWAVAALVSRTYYCATTLVMRLLTLVGLCSVPHGGKMAQFIGMLSHG